MKSVSRVSDSSRPLFEWALAFILGICLASHVSIPLHWMLGILCMSVVAWITQSRRADSTTDSGSVRLFLILVLICVGAMRLEWQELEWDRQRQLVDDLSFRGEITLRGTVIDQTPYGETRSSILLAHAEHEQWQRIQSIPGHVQLISDATGVIPGERIEVTATLAPIRSDSVPGGMDFQLYQYSRNVFSRAWAIDPPTTIAAPQWTPIRGWSHLASEWIQHQLAAMDPDEAQGLHGLAAAMALGIRGHTPDETQLALQQSGLAHLTSISGLHVTLILSGLGWLLCQMLPTQVARVVLLVISILFLFLVGFRVPTMRAVLMAWVMVGGQLLHRPVVPLNSMGLAALVLLFISPSELFLPSFQLSFVAVLAIFLFPLPRALQIKPRWLCSLLEGAWMSLVILGLMAPFSLTYFHQVPFASIPGNLIAVPLVGIGLTLVYAWLGAAMLPFTMLADGAGWLVWAIMKCLHSVILFWGTIDWLCWEPAWPGIASLALGWIGLLMMHSPTQPLVALRGFHFRTVHAGLLVLAIAVWLPSQATAPDRLRIDFVALGQGDCILIRTPSGHTLLKDAGPPARDTDTRLVDYLRSEGVSRIDALLLSHPQADHIGAMNQLLEEFPVGVFLQGPSTGETGAYDSLRQTLTRKRIPTQTLLQGDTVSIEDVTLHTLHPEADFPVSDVNEASLVLWLQYMDLDVLLTGDIGAHTEARLCARMDDWDMDILKVPHHGSRYSTSAILLEETRPEFAIIQSGRNPYGHPHPDTRQRLYDVNAHVLRNDYLGTVQVHSDGSDYWIYTTRSNTLYHQRTQ